MPQAELVSQIRKQTFPTIQAAHPDRKRRDLIAAFLYALTTKLAIEHGLDPAVIEPPVEPLIPLQTPDAAFSDPLLLGEIYNALMADKHGKGSYYTPRALADQVIALTLPPLTGDALPRVLDPALGAGMFLISAGDALAAHVQEQHPDRSPAQARWQVVDYLHGIDRDPLAVWLARVSVWLWAGLSGTSPGDLSERLIVADALLDDAAINRLHPPFDVIPGNPPYASVFTRSNADDDKTVLQQRYHTASGSFDLAVPFVERALSLCAPGGRCGLVLPNKLLAASYARVLRAWLTEQAIIEHIIDYADSDLFDASVYPVVLVMQRKEPRPDNSLTIQHGQAAAPPRTIREHTQADLQRVPGAGWSALFAPQWETLQQCFASGMLLGDSCELSAGLTVDEAYRLRDRVMESPFAVPPVNVYRLLTSGLIRRYQTRWGQATAHYLKRSYQRPVIPAAALPARRSEQSRTEKLIISGMSLRPHVYHDPGLSQASVATVIITGSTWPLAALCALLNSTLLAKLYRALYGGLALSGGYLRFGQREVAGLPFPSATPDDNRIAQLAALAQQRASSPDFEAEALDAQIDLLVYDLYTIEPL